MTESEKLVITKYDLYFEQRLTRVETTCENLKKDVAEIKIELKNIHADLRWMLGIMGTMTVILVSLMGHGFKWF